MSERASVLPLAPPELFDLDLGHEHWLRADLYATPGKAKYAAREALDARGDDWLRLGVRKVWCRIDAQYVVEMEADGIKEPYDGWPWFPAKEGDDGAVAYWLVYWKPVARAA